MRTETSRRGQAMIEMAIGMLVFALIVGGVLSIGAIIPESMRLQSMVRRMAGYEAQCNESGSTDGAPLPKAGATAVATKDDATAEFGAIEFTAAGTYKYTITERNDGVAGITYDTTPHNVVVTVVDNHDGTLTATPSYDGADSLTITNTYAASGKGTLQVTKAINDWGKAEGFTFQLAAIDGAPMP